MKLSLHTILALSAASVALTGCGSGGGANGAAPNSQTRSKVQQSLNIHALSGLAAGAQSFDFAARLNGGFMNGAPPMGGGIGLGVSPATGGNLDAGMANAGGGANALMGSVPVPMMGAFMRNVPGWRGARGRPARSRDEDPPNGGGGGSILPGEWEYKTFYFDEWLGLWVQINDTPGKSEYLLYLDEGKTQPAGHITTTWPQDWSVYPVVYDSSYSYEGGTLAGSHGSYTCTSLEDGSGSSTYENVYIDGWRNSGSSRWTPNGGCTWQSEFTDASGYWFRDAGEFRPDGSGHVRSESSDGWKTTLSYFSDGSGRGRIEGPAEGLPCTISWDRFGNITIVWADGTIERFPGWGYGDGGGGVEPATGTVSNRGGRVQR